MMINEFYHKDGRFHHLLRDYMIEKLKEPQYLDFVSWYRKIYNRETIEYFKNEYYFDLQKLKKLLPFPEWFITNFRNVQEDQIIMVLENFNQN